MKPYLLISIAILAISFSLSAQDGQMSQIVTGKKVYLINNDTFNSPKDACLKCKELYDPQNKYTYLKDSVAENGAVWCKFKSKVSGDPDWEQQGLAMGKLICPENALEQYIQNQPIPFKDLKCECYQGYIASGNKCVKPGEGLDTDEETKPVDPPIIEEKDNKCSEYSGKSAKDMKKHLIDKLKEVVDKKNEELCRDPNIAKGLLSDREFSGFSSKFGTRNYANNARGVSDATFFIMYGHIIERLAGAEVSKDPCLKKHLKYIKNSDQKDGSPDFVSTDPSVNVNADITTSREVVNKQKAGKNYDWIIYERKLKINEQGFAVPISSCH